MRAEAVLYAMRDQLARSMVGRGVLPNLVTHWSDSWATVVQSGSDGSVSVERCAFHLFSLLSNAQEYTAAVEDRAEL